MHRPAYILYMQVDVWLVPLDNVSMSLSDSSWLGMFSRYQLLLQCSQIVNTFLSKCLQSRFKVLLERNKKHQPLPKKTMCRTLKAIKINFQGQCAPFLCSTFANKKFGLIAYLLREESLDWSQVFPKVFWFHMRFLVSYHTHNTRLIATHVIVFVLHIHDSTTSAFQLNWRNTQLSFNFVFRAPAACSKLTTFVYKKLTTTTY